MMSRRQAIAASIGAAVAAVLPKPASSVPFVVGPLLYNHDASAWIDAKTLRVALENQRLLDFTARWMAASSNQVACRLTSTQPTYKTRQTLDDHEADFGIIRTGHGAEAAARKDKTPLPSTRRPGSVSTDMA